MAPPGETPAGPHQPSLKDALLCAALEGALRLALKSAPDTARALQRLGPASFAFESAVPSLALTLSLGPQEDPLFLSPGADPAAKAKATLRPGAWPRLLERGLEGAVLSGAVVVEGDRQALEALLHHRPGCAEPRRRPLRRRRGRRGRRPGPGFARPGSSPCAGKRGQAKTGRRRPSRPFPGSGGGRPLFRRGGRSFPGRGSGGGTAAPP